MSRHPTAVQAVLLDLEGTLYASGRPIEGAADALAAIRERGLGLRFLTNIDSRSPEAIAEELTGLGLGIDVDHLFTPLSAARAVIGANPGSRVLRLLSPSLHSVVPNGASEPPYTHVLVGDCREVLDYQLLDQAFRALRGGAKLLALQRGRYFTRADGEHLDTGALVAALEYSAGVEAQVLGKPALEFFALAAADVGADLAHCVVIGDDATTDVRGGRAAGAFTIQVRTGKYAAQVIEGLTDAADLVLDSIADLPAALDASS